MQQQQQQIDDLGFCPSFSCYSSNSLASTAAGRVSSQLQQEQASDSFHDEENHEFEFSILIGDDEFTGEDIASSDGRTGFPLFNRELPIRNEVVDREAARGKVLDEEKIDCSDSFEKLFVNASSSSSESDESDGDVGSPAMFCLWRHRSDAGASPLSRCKKSGSTGSGSKRWRIRDLLRRSNSEGKEPVVALSRKNVEIRKGNRSSGEATTVVGKLKPSSPSIHELLYVKQRAKREGGKRRSYLPYRQGLVGFFSPV